MVSINECVAKILREKEARIILDLLSNTEMPFTELQMSLSKKTGKTIHNQALTRILHGLDKYGLIYQKFTRKNPRYYSYYELSPLGKEILGFTEKIEETLPSVPE